MREEELCFPIYFSEPWFDIVFECLHSSIIQRATIVAFICCLDYTRPNETVSSFCGRSFGTTTTSCVRYPRLLRKLHLQRLRLLKSRSPSGRDQRWREKRADQDMRYPSRREVVSRSPDQPRESVRAGWSLSVVID